MKTSIPISITLRFRRGHGPRWPVSSALAKDVVTSASSSRLTLLEGLTKFLPQSKPYWKRELLDSCSVKPLQAGSCAWYEKQLNILNASQPFMGTMPALG